MHRIIPYVEAVKKAGNLDENQAKTLVYYCIMTWSDEPEIRPPVDLDGEAGTGKNGIMKQMKPWCRGAKWIVGREKTPAQLRDELANTTTAFVEEADKTKDPKSTENWYQLRYDEMGKEISYRRQKLNRSEYSVSEEVTCNHFGYTVLHTQNPFQSSEMERRILRITIYKNSNRLYVITEGLPHGILAQIANEIDWHSPIKQNVSNSAWDVWLPFMRVAAHLKDSEFLKYAEEQIELKNEEDNLSKVFEPKGVVFSEICGLYEEALSSEKKHIPITNVRPKVKDRGYDFDERQITAIAKNLGFTVVYPHNKAHIKMEGEYKLKEVANKMGVSLTEDIDTPLKSLRLTYVNN